MGRSGANYVSQSLADAKGDLVAATADNAVARVAVGTNGYALTADSTQSAGVGWQQHMPSRAAVAASYLVLTCRPMVTAQGTTAPPKDQWRYMPLMLRTALTIDGFAVNTTAAATGGTAALIFGLFASDSSMRPAARQADYSSYGSIDLTATAGAQTLAAASLVIPAGEWYLGCGWTGTATGAATFTSHVGCHPSVSYTPVAANLATAFAQSISGGSVPSSATPTTGGASGVVIFGLIH